MGKEQVASFTFNNAQELHHVLQWAFTTRTGWNTLVEDFDRMEIYEETLSDKSKAFSIRFTSAAARLAAIPRPWKCVQCHMAYACGGPCPECGGATEVKK